jgi:toxin CptA
MAARVDAFKYSGGATANDPAWRVVIALGPSRLVEAWIVLVAAAALAAVLATPLPAVAQAAAAVALSCAAVRAARRLACREGHGAIAGFVVDLSGRIEVEGADGTRLAGRTQDGSFVAPWLTIVRWRPDGARFPRSILVAPDGVAEDSFRRLRILLRWR